LRRIKSGSEQREYLKTLGFVLSENHGEGFSRLIHFLVIFASSRVILHSSKDRVLDCYLTVTLKEKPSDGSKETSDGLFVRKVKYFQTLLLGLFCSISRSATMLSQIKSRVLTP